jgi:putative acetyltransferase
MSRLERVCADAPDVARLLDRHFNLMRAQSPPESCHVLPAASLSAPDVRLFALREDACAVAVGALKISGTEAELKSMHTAEEFRGRGLARQLLRGLIDHARNAGVKRLDLETGSGVEHAPARALYTSQGFTECPPFGEYVADPLSMFMTRAI